MSRIYEALQKAEAERHLDQQEPATRIADYPASAESTTAVAEVDDLAAASPNVSRRIQDAPRRAAGGSLDLSTIVARPWAMSLAQLPALLERGPAVEQFRSLRSRIFEPSRHQSVEDDPREQRSCPRKAKASSRRIWR